MAKRDQLFKIDQDYRYGVQRIYTSGVVSSGTLIAHALDDLSVHTGTLAESQAPWAITTTVFAAHVADPDAHHAKQHLITDPAVHTVTGNLYDLVAITTTNTLGLLGTTTDGNANPAKVLRTDTGGAVTVTNLFAATDVITPLITAPVDLTIDPGGHVVFPNAQILRSYSFDSAFPILGWELYETQTAGKSGLTIGSISADEIRTRVFVADETRVDRGEQVIGKSYGFVNADYTTPAAAGGDGNSIWFDNSPAIAGAIFSSGDWIVFRIFEDATGFSITTIWLQVYSTASGAVPGYLMDSANDRQRWRAVLREGSTNYDLKKGSFGWDYGQSGQGVILSSAVDQSGAPYIKIFTWTGSDPYSPANRTTQVQLGYLGNAPQNGYLSPSGWGLFAQNVFLQGDLVTAGGDIRMLTGSGINVQQDSGAFWDTSKRALRWWPDVNTRSGSPSLSILSSKVTSGLPNNQDYNWIKAHPANGVWAQLQIDALGQGGRNPATIYMSGGSLSAGYYSQIYFYADNIQVNSPTTTLETVTVEQLHANGAVPGAHDIGTAGTPFSTLYVNSIVATSVTTSGALGGQIWQYDAADMYIRSNSSASRTLYIANPGSGSMSLNVEGSITSGGTVNNVDIAALNSSFASLLSSYNSHVANADAHHARSHVFATTTGLGTDHTVSGLTAGMVIRASSSTAARFAILSHDDLTGISPDQHHAKSHILASSSGLGADHTVSGLTTGHALRATSGTTAAFAQMQHSDLGGVTANQHHNQVHDILGGDHTYTGGASLDVFGLSAPGTLARLTPSSNPGAAGAILRSTSGGGLTLQSLTVNGSVDVLNGGDLTVGNNVLFVDVSGTNVGINRAPDTQFDLDVLGNFRAGGFIVGQHAIQLASAKMILHFDGPAPYATDYTGEPTGHFGQVGTETGGVVYRVGKFGKGVQVCEGSTNQCPNPSFENNTTGWSEVNDTNNHATLTQSTAEAYVGSACLKLTCDTASSYSHSQRHFHGPNSGSAWSNGSTATISAWVKGNGTWRIAFEDSSNNLRGFTEFTLATTDDWQRFSVTATNSSGSNFSSYKMVIFPMSSGATTLYVDAVQYEDKPYATAYFDGSFGDLKGYAWTNTLAPHNSTSTRTAAAVTYNTAGVINPARGTIMGWIKSSHAGATDPATIVDVAGTGINGMYIYLNGSGKITGSFGTGAVSTTAISDPGVIVAEQWTHFAFTWGTTGEGSKLYINGDLAISTSAEPALILPATMTVGRFNTSAIRFFNGIIDDLVFTDRTESAAQIRAIYESNAPVFAESSVFQFRAGNGLVWGDNEGLWMRDTTGNNVLGVSGVSGKSWGGLVLDPGDFLLGSTTNGYLLYDASAAQFGITLATAGSNFLTLNPTTGLTIATNTATSDDNRSVTWATSGVTTSYIKGYSVSSSDALFLGTNALTGHEALGLFYVQSIGTSNSTLSLQARRDAAGVTMNLFSNTAESKLTLTTIPGAGITDHVVIDASYTKMSGRAIVGEITTPAGQLEAAQTSTSAAIPALRLRQSDVSEEFIEFAGTVSAGNPIDTAAVGTYYGKIRVSVNGTYKYVALYNS